MCKVFRLYHCEYNQAKYSKLPVVEVMQGKGKLLINLSHSLQFRLSDTSLTYKIHCLKKNSSKIALMAKHNFPRFVDQNKKIVQISWQINQKRIYSVPSPTIKWSTPYHMLYLTVEYHIWNRATSLCNYYGEHSARCLIWWAHSSLFSMVSTLVIV